MSDLTPKGFSNGKYVDRFLLRDTLYEEDAITMGGVAILNNFPTADVVEVVHARPVKFYCDARTGRMITTCSACDLKIGPYDSFCKNCGAKLDGGQDDV